jgi:hypothetical protein
MERKYPSQGINGAKNIQPDAEGLNWNFAPGIFPGGTDAEIKYNENVIVLIRKQ